ncbi:hypothetical protein [Pelotalea chapellei]
MQRFWNNEVFENIEGVLELIRLHCLKATSPPPAPSFRPCGSARGGGR